MASGTKILILGSLARLAGVALVLQGCGGVSHSSNDGGLAGAGGSAVGSGGSTGTGGSAGGAAGSGAAGGASTGGSIDGGQVDAATCGANGSACTSGASTGLCESGVCGPCTDTTDDSTCTAAYGSASMPYLCIAGACVPGDCRTDADCASNAAGALCGPTTENVCGPCTTDSQCAADNPATPICNTAKGKCVAGTCTPATTNPPAACSANSGDVCCTTVCQAGPPSGGVACCPTSDSTTYCTTKLGMAASCIAYVCTACPGVTDGKYTVDPVNGSDTAGSGYGAQAGCAFKTITRALAVIGTPTLASSITVVGPATVSAGESFPLLLPGNLTLTTSGGGVTVNVPSAADGFRLNNAGTTITGATGAKLTISGQKGKANIGILVSGKSTTATTISNLTVSGFIDEGILVNGSAALSIGPGVVASGNGATTTGVGLYVAGSGNAVIDVPAGSATTSFDSNNFYGIAVVGTAHIKLTGSVTSATAGTGTVTTNKNARIGLVVEQTPGTPPQNVIDGLVSFGNTGGRGIWLGTGSNVQVRNSAALGNNGDGIFVGANSTGTSNDISKIDLGTASSPGLNTVQEELGAAGINMSAGICLDAPAGAGNLSALGNIFGSVNCSTTAGKLTINKAGCANVSTCTGSICDLGVHGAGNNITVTQCTHP